MIQTHKTNMANYPKTAADLQEIIGMVFPPHTGNLEDAVVEVFEAAAEQDLSDAYDYANNFDPAIATEYCWQKLDWAFSVPGFIETYPELAFQVQHWLEEHYSITKSYQDLAFMLEAAIESGRTLNKSNVEEGINTFWNQFGHTLPEEFRVFVEHAFRSAI